MHGTDRDLRIGDCAGDPAWQATRRNKAAVQRFVERFGISVLPASYEVASPAIAAFARYGKGRHPAKLNFGDCFSYAGARQSGLPLLYVGGDFARTDLARSGLLHPTSLG